ncbi:mitochondrial carrier domain-containing protein [Phellopilus nigrolimitatus]|nr:mitochondrial carrier domain-containing protein [Phellopilus nigrolimitatus]
MVRLQGDFAKPHEKRLNYKNCFDGIYRVVRDEGTPSLARGVTPNVFRAVLMNASQLASYDYFKAELLKTPYFNDNIYCHFTASFAAGTVATTVCSPADVIKSRIMNASGPGSNSTLQVIRNSLKNEGPLFVFKGWLPARVALPRRARLLSHTEFYLHGTSQMDKSAADDDPHLPHPRVAQTRR